jgi:hypothetical protein
MQIHPAWLVIAALVFILLVVGVWYQWFKTFNSPKGERYQKMLTQGPFAPIPPSQTDLPK